jgi:hypothetical protein
MDESNNADMLKTEKLKEARSPRSNEKSETRNQELGGRISFFSSLKLGEVVEGSA